MSLPGGGPIGSGFTASNPMPVQGERSFATSVAETVNGSPLDRKKRKRRMSNFAGYRSSNRWAKTPEGKNFSQRPSQTGIDSLAP